MTINGKTPENVEEWFVLYNHAQIQKAVAKMMQGTLVSVLFTAAGFTLFLIFGSWIPGAVKIGTVLSPAVFNTFLYHFQQEPNPSQLVVSLVMSTWFRKVTGLADWYVELGLLPDAESKAKYNAIAEKINKGYSADEKKAEEEDEKKAKEAESEKTDDSVPPGTATNQGAKAEVPAPSEPAVAQTPAVKRQYDYQGREINPDGSLK
jgi:hypothetical protein